MKTKTQSTTFHAMCFVPLKPFLSIYVSLQLPCLYLLVFFIKNDTILCASGQEKNAGKQAATCIMIRRISSNRLEKCR